MYQTRWFLAAALFAMLMGLPAFAAERETIRIDCSKRLPAIRALHGVNGGPLNYGETLDLSGYWKELAIPITRLHDCEWPNGDIVDMHAVFPNPSADPAAESSYRFARTDDFLKAIAATGSRMVYRLGENIEHTKRKHHVHPPQDVERWAQACLGIIRHYNEGWADGQRLDIRYWEVWNEPENRPAMWTGTDEDYFRLYAATSKAIRKEFPQLKIGGPAAGAIGEVRDGKLEPNSLLTGFARQCREQSLPLDFFSFHCYAKDPTEIVRRAKAVRGWLDEQDFAAAEIHLNEWNYLADNDWGPVMVSGQGEGRQRWYARMAGAEGAAFVAATLIVMQDSPIDVANYFTGDSGPFGLFTQHGVPKKTFYAMKAFRQLLETLQRVSCELADSRIVGCAGMNEAGDQITVLLASQQSKPIACPLQVAGVALSEGTNITAFALDDGHNLEGTNVPLSTADSSIIDCEIPGPGVLLLKIDLPRK